MPKLPEAIIMRCGVPIAIKLWIITAIVLGIFRDLFSGQCMTSIVKSVRLLGNEMTLL